MAIDASVFEEIRAQEKAKNDANEKTLPDDCDIKRLVNVLKTIRTTISVEWPNPETEECGWIDFTCGEECMTMHFDHDGSRSVDDDA